MEEERGVRGVEEGVIFEEGGPRTEEKREEAPSV